MYQIPIPLDEADRVAAVRALQLLDTPPEERFDRISRLATSLLEVPVAYVSLMDADRQWVKSVCGMDAMPDVPRSLALCSYTIMAEEPIAVGDLTEDERFRENPFVTGPPGVRFYVGIPLVGTSGHRVGTLCAMDFTPRDVDRDKVRQLADLARVAETEINLLDILELKSRLHSAYQDLERNHRFIRDVFGRYVTDQVADALLNSPDKLQLGGKNRVLSILMSDLRDFSGLSERLTPPQVVDLLNRYLGRMVEVISRHQGTIDEFIGDAILVIFGAPLYQEDHAARAVACAVDMQLAMEEFNAENQSLGLGDQGMGVGINTGEVVVGNIGSDRRMKYSVVGSPVNLAARIESFTLGGQILISESTLKAAGPEVRVDGHLRVKVKGFEGPISIYEVSGMGAPYNLHLPRTRYAVGPRSSS